MKKITYVDAATARKAAKRMRALIEKDPAWKRAEARESRLRNRGIKQLRDRERGAPSMMMNLAGPLLSVRPRTPVAHRFGSETGGIGGSSSTRWVALPVQGLRSATFRRWRCSMRTTPSCCPAAG